MALFVVAAVACQSADATPDFVASASMLAGSSDPSLDLGAKWTKAAKITVSVTTPSGVATTEACLSLTDIASAGPNRVTPDVSPYTTCTSPDIKVSGFGALSPKTGLLTLPPGDGLKTVHARFRKADGKVAAVRSSTIVLDTLAPVFASDAASFAAKDSAVEVTLLKPATDVGGSGVASYAVYAVSSAYDAEAPALPGARGTTGTALTCVPLRNRLTCGGLVNGAQYALRLVPVDFAGNAAEGLTSGVLIPAPASHDGAAPAVSADSLRLIDAKSRSLLPGKAVNVAKLTLRLSATGPRDVKVGRYCLYEEGGACVWAKARTEAVAFTEDVSYELRKSVTGAAAEGPKALFAKFRDVLGGESPVVALSGLVYDVTKPVAPASASTTLGQGGFTLALSGAPSDAGSGLVPLNDGLVVSASTGTTEPAKGCTGPVVLSKSGAVWASPALKPGTSYRLRVCAVDRAGNVSDGAVASPAVVWRPTMNGPTGRVTAAPTRTAAFTLQIAATGDAGAKVASYFVSAASTLPEGAPFIAFSRPSATLAQAVTHTLSDTALDGARTFFVWLKDEYGNVGALGAQSVVLDTTAPAVTGVTLSLPRAAGATTSLYGAAVSVSLANPRRDASSGDPTAIRSVSGLYKLGASAFTAADKRPLACTGADLAWTCVAPAGLDVSQGRLQVAVTAVDAAGNAVTVRKEAAAALDAAPDTSAPDEVTGLAVMRSTSGTRGLLSWNGSLDDDVVGYLAVRSEGNVAPADCDGGRLTGSTSGTTLAVDGLDATKPYAFRVCAVDAAGNVSPGATTRPPGCTDDQPACVPLSDVPRTDARDYAFSSWPTNQRPPDPRWPGYQHEQHLLTGRYGAVFREETGSLTRLGAFQNVLSEDAARHRGNDDLAALPGVTLTWEAGPVDGTLVASQFLGDNGSTDIVARLSEGGRFMNRLEIPDVRYAGDGSLRGVVQVASMPRHLVLTEVVKGTVAGPGSSVARLRLGGPLLAGLPRAEWLVPGRAVRLTGHDGAGWLFVVYDAPGTTSSLTRTASGELVAERSSALPVATQEISLLAVPLDALNPDELAFYLAPETQVSVGYTLLDRHGQPAKAPVTVAWDRRVGAFHATLGTLAAAGLSGSRDYDARPELHDWYGRHRLTVDTHGRGPMAVPLLFEGTGAASLYITGGVALLRDASGEPVGVPVQLSKNWHDTTTGAWYRLFSQPVFSGLEPATLELTMVSSRWGADAYAASHAQLSLIGWNGQGARWDESAMGCFGESITYNPDRTFRSMVDDVRPFLVQSQDVGGRWNWTGNVGGADFLQYRSAVNQPGWRRQLSRMRTTYRSQGPNLTEVVYSGVTLDGAIRSDITVRMGRTDDLVRTWFELDNTFLQDVTYDRLAFFQMAADDYGDNGYAWAAWGNEGGQVGQRAITDHRTTGYASSNDRGLALAGPSPWVMLYDNQRTTESLPEQYADVAFVVRDFRADIGGTIVTTPHLNVNRTFNGLSQLGLELGLPYENSSPWCGAPCLGRTNFIPAGSRVRATVEYLVLPADKSRYYGESDHLAAMPAESYRTPEMARAMAAGGALTVEAQQGIVTRIHPVELTAASGGTAAEFTLTGGLGHVPVTVTGLVRHDRWRLERLDGAAWTPVDQSVEGNDFWQARFDDETQRYTLTWNVPNRGTRHYRVRWQP